MRLGLLILALCASTVAFADTSASCTAYEISATKAGAASLDGDLKPLATKLQDPPFSAWNVFKLLGKYDVSLPHSKAQAVTLKVGKASLMLRDRSDKRVQLEVLIDDDKGSRVVSAKPDQPVDEWLVFGSPAPSSKKDGHLLALRCK